MSTAPPSTPKPISLSFDTTLPPSPSPLTRSTPPASASLSSSKTGGKVSPTLSRFDRLPIGSRMEISPASWEIARGIGKLVSASKDGGAGLVVDYGDGKGFGRSWRVRSSLSSFDVLVSWLVKKRADAWCGTGIQKTPNCRSAQRTRSYRSHSECRFLFPRRGDFRRRYVPPLPPSLAPNHNPNKN